MARYVRFAFGAGLGMAWSVGKPLLGLLRTPQTAVALVLGVVLSTAILSWTLNAMLGLDPDVVL